MCVFISSLGGPFAVELLAVEVPQLVRGLTIGLSQITLVLRTGWTSLPHGHLFCYQLLLDETVRICDSKNGLLVKLRSGLTVGLNHFRLYFSLLVHLKMVTVIALGLEFVFPP